MASPSAQSAIQNIEPGGGRIVLGSHGAHVAFSELSSTYPLKLLSPQIAQDGVAVVYVLTYGGGLVGGDSVNLAVTVSSDAVLVLLSQGSTKVFKTRSEARLASVRLRGLGPHSAEPAPTSQSLEVTLHAHSSLFLLPDPVTCFRSASYNQIQTFRLSSSASLILLDWVTSGRKSRGEEWAFSRYYSANEVWVDGVRIAKDVMLLDTTVADMKPLPPRPLCDRLAPYSCYATLILCGALVQGTIADLSTRYATISVFKTGSPDDLIWSLSSISTGGAVVRIAGKETEIVKRWLGNALRPLEEVVGVDVYRRAFS